MKVENKRCEWRKIETVRAIFVKLNWIDCVLSVSGVLPINIRREEVSGSRRDALNSTARNVFNPYFAENEINFETFLFENYKLVFLTQYELDKKLILESYKL